MTFRSQDIDDLASKSSFEFSLCFRGCTTFAFAAPLFLFGLHLFWDCLLWGVAPPFINHIGSGALRGDFGGFLHLTLALE